MNSSSPDPIDDLLSAKAPDPVEPPLRQAVLDRTMRVLRRRRWRRRLVHAGALAASFLLGAACMRWWTPPAREYLQPPQAHVVPGPQPKEQEMPLAVAGIVEEWKAFDDRKRQRQHYRQAGDLYFYTNQDYESALRCYRQALDAASDDDLAIAPDDNWLLMALKEARIKEKSDARNDG